jgi:hypothetical protein
MGTYDPPKTCVFIWASALLPVLAMRDAFYVFDKLYEVFGAVEAKAFAYVHDFSAGIVKKHGATQIYSKVV